MNISQNTDSEGEARWSPDGQTIVFDSVHNDGYPQVSVMAPDGTHRKLLTGLWSLHPVDGSFPTWSPDGTHIAFSSAHDGAPGLFIMNADGTNIVKLIEGLSSPIWSPNGKYLATVQLPPAITIIDVADPQALSPFPQIADGFEPAWSPDGKRMAFVRQPVSGKTQIFIVSIDGTNQLRISDPNFYEGEPAWRPDPSSH